MVWQGAEICEEGGGENGGFRSKRKESCCNSPVVRRVPKNADSICEQFNREALGTQEKFISEFQNQEVPYANSR